MKVVLSYLHERALIDINDDKFEGDIGFLLQQMIEAHLLTLGKNIQDYKGED